ncbi:hypothetical protein EVAR_31435_1 [Eumeta japonica]|uniref:Uncharacterized protein n=1 Tax=Eumeta variegata TaxID=151549 RepID=A0A4C1UYJ5_EUMVA|nr:hypothetical protein EVAR_31435_1 [Eumeta japonica]
MDYNKILHIVKLIPVNLSIFEDRRCQLSKKEINSNKYVNLLPTTNIITQTKIGIGINIRFKNETGTGPKGAAITDVENRTVVGITIDSEMDRCKR